MKCPKCGYLGFETVDRCRNCGYDFSLVTPSPGPELPLKIEAPRMQVIEDVSMGRSASPSAAAFDDELPLFGRHLDDDMPLITKPSPPRTPLAVRRATPEVSRVRVTPRPPALEVSRDVELPTWVDPRASEMRRHDSREPIVPHPTPVVPAPTSVDASMFARLAAALIDVVVLGAIDVIVVYFTLQICGIGLADWAAVPLVPLAAFFLVLNGGYLVIFTAGGQTLGKMVAGIKVVSSEPLASMDLGSACLRALAWLVLAAPAGLGLLSVFAGDHRGIHDRFAGTRVVRVSS